MKCAKDKRGSKKAGRVRKTVISDECNAELTQSQLKNQLLSQE